MMSRTEIVGWLRETDLSRLDLLRSDADETRCRHVGDSVHLRGIIDFSNHCTRRCTYCGINADNKTLRRYRMSIDEIVTCAKSFKAQGLMTVVLQSGEDRRNTTDWITELILRIRQETGLAITLSLGERRPEELETWRTAGAERYLLKIETTDRALYESTQPGRRNAWPSRFATLETLRALDYEVGSGIMVGLPGQTMESLADDLVHLGRFGPDMIGIGPWIPHPAASISLAARDETDQVPNDLRTTLKVLALARLVCPDTNLPATTALLSVGLLQAWEGGLSGGANVIMPDRTPAHYGRLYTIYPGRISFAPEDLMVLRDAIHRMGRTISSDSGASAHYQKRTSAMIAQAGGEGSR
ncbi:[FeFe] hydrogenase H-cluster radical SAM maturase HydE [Candidatus Zixiibacteriota bacterium]